MRSGGHGVPPRQWKGSLTGKAVVLKTTGSLPCRFESCPFRQNTRAVGRSSKQVRHSGPNEIEEELMPRFIPGLKLSSLFYREAVKPIIDNAFPRLRYSA